MNGIIPNLTGAAPGGAPSVLERGLATYGSLTPVPRIA